MLSPYLVSHDGQWNQLIWAICPLPLGRRHNFLRLSHFLFDGDSLSLVTVCRNLVPFESLFEAQSPIWKDTDGQTRYPLSTLHPSLLYRVYMVSKNNYIVTSVDTRTTQGGTFKAGPRRSANQIESNAHQSPGDNRLQAECTSPHSSIIKSNDVRIRSDQLLSWSDCTAPPNCINPTALIFVSLVFFGVYKSMLTLKRAIN